MVQYNVVFLFVGLVSFAQASNVAKTDNAMPTQQQVASTPCTTDSDCSDLKDAKCVNSFCQCKNNQTCEEVIVESRKVTKLNETCKASKECLMEHSECRDGLCKCENGKIASDDNRRCLTKSIGLGHICQEDIQCLATVSLSRCLSNECTCQEKTHNYNGQCYSDVALDETCKDIGECSITTFARCVEEKCTCETGYIPNNSSSKCLQIATKTNDICYENIQCQKILGRAVCKQGFCQCEELFEYKKSRGTCVRDLKIGEICEDHSDCHGIEEGESRLECILGTCKCQSTFTEVMGFCTRNRAPSSFGSPIVTTVLVLLFLFLSK